MISEGSNHNRCLELLSTGMWISNLDFEPLQLGKTVVYDGRFINRLRLDIRLSRHLNYVKIPVSNLILINFSFFVEFLDQFSSNRAPHSVHHQTV